ncbi:hypothetical protein GCM10027591_03820 [Zhihengliuella somnathii]
MALIDIEECPSCHGKRIRRRKAREQSVAGGDMDWWCDDCRRVVADAGRVRR